MSDHSSSKHSSSLICNALYVGVGVVIGAAIVAVVACYKTSRQEPRPITRVVAPPQQESRTSGEAAFASATPPPIPPRNQLSLHDCTELISVGNSLYNNGDAASSLLNFRRALVCAQKQLSTLDQTCENNNSDSISHERESDGHSDAKSVKEWLAIALNSARGCGLSQCMLKQLPPAVLMHEQELKYAVLLQDSHAQAVAHLHLARIGADIGHIDYVREAIKNCLKLADELRKEELKTIGCGFGEDVRGRNTETDGKAGSLDDSCKSPNKSR